MRKRTCWIFGMIVAAATSAFPAYAASTVNIELRDASASGSLEGMKMVVRPGVTKAGPVILQVTNKSRTLIHEVVVIKTDKTASDLPYNAENQAIDESKINKVGEVSDLDPGKSGKITLDLRAGNYLLACNQPGHAHAGMWTKLKVDP